MKFYANPYNTSVTGFFFETLAEYEMKSAALKDEFGTPVEEFEIDVIDGTAEECALARVANVSQGEIESFIELIDGDESQWPAVFYVMDNLGVPLEVALGQADDYSIVESSLLDAATELFDECYGESIPDSVKQYIDYESFARDCRSNS